MKLLLFLDDWLLDGKVDVVRKYEAATITKCIETPRGALSSVDWNKARNCFCVNARSGGKILVMESADGKKWKKGPQHTLRQVGEPPQGCKINMGEWFSSIFKDEDDPDPSRRYKIVGFPYCNKITKIGGVEGGPGAILCSPDGVHWTVNARHHWFTNPRGSDTTNNMFYNPRRNVWQVICRKNNLDRRISMTESPDLENWTAPRIILHPDSLDGPLMQMYGMGAMCYEKDYFIGALQCYHVPSEETSADHCLGAVHSWSKWGGSVDGQLAYSYDGECWLRSDRSVFIPRTEPGTFGGPAVYPCAFNIPDGRKTIEIHGLGCLYGHGIGGDGRKEYPFERALLVHSLRFDGFAYLEPIGGWGRITTRCLVPRNGKLTLNYQAPMGQLLVQVSDMARRPIKGYRFEDCIPLQGDELSARVRWKRNPDLSSLIGKRIRLEVRMCDARLYAIRVDCGLWYTNTPAPVDQL